MANNKKSINRANKSIRNIAQTISSNMDAIYRSTYMNSPQQGKELDNLSDRINKNLDRIVDRNMEMIGEPSITRLYSRMIEKNKGINGDTVLDLNNPNNSSLLNEDIYGMFMSNSCLKEFDNEIDTICRYMPELLEALETQRDNVLAADHFSKDYINMTNSRATSEDERNTFGERFKKLKRKYNIEELVENAYMDSAKYGEKFIYIVPYKTAIAKLLASKGNTTSITNYSSIKESYTGKNSELQLFRIHDNTFDITNSEQDKLLTESGIFEPNTKISGKNNNDNFSIFVQFNTSGILESAVYGYHNANISNNNSRYNSMQYLYESSLTEASDKKNIEAKGNIDLGGNKLDDRMIPSNDGLITPTKVEELKINGAVVEELKREQVIPIYINSINMGYYYIEVRALDQSSIMDTGFNSMMSDSIGAKSLGMDSMFNNVDKSRQDNLLRYISGKLSASIDKAFVNNNQDLSNEIYMILKHNDLFNTPSSDIIKITFIPPEDMVHFAFKIDEDTHRGISDLEKSLIPAKIYTSLYLTNSLAQITRGQDKRVYYVKQTVDTNIAQVLLNTISQIKQSNFGVRSFQNINNILNITGKFDDYVIPTNASGESPIQFEVMPGQDVKTPTELMDQLKQASINATGVPIEIIQARQSIDYAAQLSMSSSKFLKWCFNRQSIVERLLSKMMTYIYNYEYNDNAEINVTLPPPCFLNITNTNQLVDNVKTFVQSLTEMDLSDEDDDRLKNRYNKYLFHHYMGTHIDESVHKSILEKCRMELKAEDKESHSNGESESEY